MLVCLLLKQMRHTHIHTYCSTIHDQCHLSGLVDVAPEGYAGTHAPLAAVVRSASER